MIAKVTLVVCGNKIVAVGPAGSRQIELNSRITGVLSVQKSKTGGAKPDEKRGKIDDYVLF